jgi:hypothetical protein
MTPNAYRYRFDFEIGYLVQSPCRTCRRQDQLPACACGCTLLEKVRALLAESVSTRSRRD